MSSGRRSPDRTRPRPSAELGRRCAAWLLAAAAAWSLSAASASPPLDPLPRFFSYFGDDTDRLPEIAGRYEVLIWHHHPELRAALAEVKRRNPRVTGLMYRELFCVLQDETPLEESVGSYAWIDRAHPEWFQRDPAGGRVEVPDYPGRWMMDLGHPGWQAFWIEETLRDVVEGSWDGVLADDALTSVHAHDLPPLAGYPDDASLQRAVSTFLARAHAAFQRAGKLLIANASNTYDYPGLWERWLGVTDGLMEEHFAGDGWTWGAHVAGRQLEAVRLAARRGKWVFCQTYGAWSEEARMRASLAAYLVSAGPRAFWSYRPSREAETPPWHPSWELALGHVLDIEPRKSGAVWERAFERGAVFVNSGERPRAVDAHPRPIQLRGRQGVILLTAKDRLHGSPLPQDPAP